MPEPLTAADCRLLLSLLNHAIVAPEQRGRVETWLMDQCETAQTIEECAAKVCEPAPALTRDEQQRIKSAAMRGILDTIYAAP